MPRLGEATIVAETESPPILDLAADPDPDLEAVRRRIADIELRLASLHQTAALLITDLGDDSD